MARVNRVRCRVRFNLMARIRGRSRVNFRYSCKINVMIIDMVRTWAQKKFFRVFNILWAHS